MKTISRDLEFAQISNRLRFLEIYQRVIGVRPRFLSALCPIIHPREF